MGKDAVIKSCNNSIKSTWNENISAVLFEFSIHVLFSLELSCRLSSHPLKGNWSLPCIHSWCSSQITRCLTFILISSSFINHKDFSKCGWHLKRVFVIGTCKVAILGGILSPVSLIVTTFLNPHIKFAFYFLKKILDPVSSMENWPLK